DRRALRNSDIRCASRPDGRPRRILRPHRVLVPNRLLPSAARKPFDVVGIAVQCRRYRGGFRRRARDMAGGPPPRPHPGHLANHRTGWAHRRYGREVQQISRSYRSIESTYSIITVAAHSFWLRSVIRNRIHYTYYGLVSWP